jgi:hypothetical protein
LIGSGLQAAAEFDPGYLQLSPEQSISSANYVEAPRD